MIQVRRATITDCEAVSSMLTCFATSYQPSRSAFDTIYPTLVYSPDAYLLVAEDDSGIQGYIYASDTPTLFANGTITEVLELYVVESQRRRGIGRSLVDSVVADARRRGSVEVTGPTRRADAFYRAIGFEPTAELFKLRLGE